MTVISSSGLNKNFIIRSKNISSLKLHEENCEDLKIVEQQNNSNSHPIKLEQKESDSEHTLNLKSVDHYFHKSQLISGQEDVKNSKSK